MTYTIEHYEHKDCCVVYDVTVTFDATPGQKQTWEHPAEPPQIDVQKVVINEATFWRGDYGYAIQSSDLIQWSDIERELTVELDGDSAFREAALAHANDVELGAKEEADEAKFQAWRDRDAG
jgi:hypothetical protein